MMTFNRQMWWLFCVFSVTASPQVEAQEWTRFRGPNGTGISDAKTIPTQWTERDFNWKVALPGIGHSSPVVWGEKIFLTSTDEAAGKIIVHCHRTLDGVLLWRKDFSVTPHKKHKFNSYASGTPAVDAERVYVCWNDPSHFPLIALDHDGKQVWERDLGPFLSENGGGNSPIVYRDLVVVANEQDGESFLLAIDAKTGKDRWKTPRRSAKAAYSTPCVYEAPGQKPLLIFNSQAHGIGAIDPETGKPVWEYASAFDKRSVSSPIVASGLVIGSCGSGGGGIYAVAVRPGDSATGKKPELAYELRKSAPYVPTGVAVGDLLFLWSDAGILSCLHGATGEVKWQERVGGNYFASPICVDGRLFNASTSGEMVVVEASGHFRELARNPLGEMTHSTPAVAAGRMYIRTLGHLICVGGPRTSS